MRDPEHHTFSSWYADLTDKKPYHDENDLHTILNAIGEATADRFALPQDQFLKPHSPEPARWPETFRSSRVYFR